MKRSALSLLAIAILIAPMVLAVEPSLATSTVDNPKEDYWVSKTPMNQPRAGVGVVAVDGKIYAIGGASTARGQNQAENLLSTNEEYNPTTDSWTIKPSMPTPRAYFGIAAIENKIYCIGGVVGSEKLVDGPFTHSLFVYSGITEVYDTITETWDTRAAMPIERGNIARFQANVVDGKIYAIGAKFTYVYDPATDSWTEKTPIPEKVSPNYWGVSSTAIGSQIYVTGMFETGILDYDDQRLFIYDTLTDDWTESASGSFLCGMGIGATTGVRAPQLVYVLGLPPMCQAYDPLTGNWTSAAPNPIDQRDFGCVVLNDVMYVIGGYVDSGEVTAANQAYYPIGFSPLPEISILSPQMQTYNESSVSLNFTVDRPVSWMSYSLDKSDNTTITGNYTLSELSAGVHNVTVYVGDSFGNVGASETVVFTVVDAFPLAFAIGIIVIGIIVTAALSLLLLRRNKKTVMSRNVDLV